MRASARPLHPECNLGGIRIDHEPHQDGDDTTILAVNAGEDANRAGSLLDSSQPRTLQRVR